MDQYTPHPQKGKKLQGHFFQKHHQKSDTVMMCKNSGFLTYKGWNGSRIYKLDYAEILKTLMF